MSPVIQYLTLSAGQQLPFADLQLAEAPLTSTSAEAGPDVEARGASASCAWPQPMSKRGTPPQVAGPQTEVADPH